MSIITKTTEGWATPPTLIKVSSACPRSLSVAMTLKIFRLMRRAEPTEGRLS